jgi:hypothetical protein
MNRSHDISVITRFLEQLPHTGPAGFEGLTARLCEAATGQRFRLSGTGSQSGQDARAEPGYENNIKVEAKHYRKSSLNLRELAAELLQAFTADPNLELWILAASIAVKDQHAAQLESYAQVLNLELLILDVGNDGLPRMAVLMAAFPTVLHEWIDEFAPQAAWPGLAAALGEIRGDIAFGAARAQLLRKLQGTLLGYDDARERVNRKFLDTISDLGNATATFNQRVAIRAKGIQLISRISVSDLLVTWWKASSSAVPNAVVLGEEGTGKTWAVLAWLAERVQGGSLPLILPFSTAAEAISAGDTIATLLPKLLRKWTGLGDNHFWERRFRKWLADPGLRQILVLIVVDGLNERSSLNWPSFFAAAENEHWRDRVAILATDRPLHWRPNCATAGLDNFMEILISGYTDSELNQALQGKGIDLNQIPHELQKLIRTPRYCDLVTAHFEEMKREGDFTVERLIWLDARTRAQKRRGALTESEFIEVIRNLADRYRQSNSLTLSAIQFLLPSPDPDRHIYQEIIDGGLLIQKSGLSPRFVVERTRLVFGLGMLLAEESAIAVNSGKDRLYVEGEIARWFEPHPEMDLKVEICGAALFHSLVAIDYPPGARRALFLYWLRLRNWHDTAQAAFVDYVVRCPEDFVAAAEDVWSSDRDLGAAQEFLANAFVKHRDEPRVSPTLKDAISRWMGFVHPAGDPIFRRKPENEAVLRKEIERRADVAMLPGPVEICGEHLTVIENDGLLRLKRLAFLIMSSGLRAPFVHACFPWALASAVMGHHVESDVAAWVMRLSDEDLASVIISKAEHLLGRPEQLAQTAGRRLIGLFDPVRADVLFESHPDEYYERWKREKDRHAADPCVSFYKWSDEDCNKCLAREDVAVTRILGQIKEHLYDPKFDIPASLLRRASVLLLFDPMKFRTGISATEETYALEITLPLLASRDPRAISELVSRLIPTLANRNGMELYGLALWLHGFAQLLSVDQADDVIACLGRIASSTRDKSANSTDAFDQDISEAFLILSAAAKITTDRLLSVLLDRPSGAHDLLRFQPWLCGLTADGIQRAKEVLTGATDDSKKVRALWFLAFNPVKLEDDVRQYVVRLVHSDNRVLKGAALRFACLAGDEALGLLLVNSEFSFATDGEFLDSMWGPHLFVTFAAHVPFEILVRRIHPADAGFALSNKSAGPNDINIYATLLDACIIRIINASDSNVARLPRIVGNPAEQAPAKFPIFAQQDEGPSIKSSDLTWGAQRPQETMDEQSLRDLFDTQKFIEKQNRMSKERVEDVFTAWGTDAYNWFGRNFSYNALNLVCQSRPDLVTEWVKQICTAESAFRRLQGRLGSFMSQLCSVLLFQRPDLGRELWSMLRSEKYGPVLFDSILAAFRADDSTAASQARWEALGDCCNDGALSRFAYLAEAFGKTTWLSTAVQELVSHPAIWRRAKGLTIASFSNVSVQEFDGIAAAANVGDTWVEPQVPALRVNVLQNQYAQQWYRVFLDAEIEERSWGASRMLLLCGDSRFFTWRHKYEKDEDSKHLRRLKLLDANLDVNREMDREKQRKDTLFGIRIEQGEVYPFMNH